MIASRSRDDARPRNLSREQVGERAARLERSRMLQLLELQRERKRVEPELGGVDLDERGAADVRPDQGFDRGDAVPADRAGTFLGNSCHHINTASPSSLPGLTRQPIRSDASGKAAWMCGSRPRMTSQQILAFASFGRRDRRAMLVEP